MTAGPLAAVLVVVMLLAVTACSDSEDTSPSTTTESASGGGTLRIGLVDVEPTAVFDPLAVAPTNPSAMIALDLVSDSLTEWPGGVGSTEPAEPAIAESITPDDAHTEWTVTIDPERSFSDGTAITADDVAFSLQRVKDAGSSSLAGARLDVIDAVEAVDDATVRITTVEPFVQLPELLASPLFGIVSEVAMTDEGSTVGSGPCGVDAQATPEAGEEGGDSMLLTCTGSGAGDGFELAELVPFDGVTASFQALGRGELDWSLAPADASEPELGEAAIQLAEAGVVSWLGINAADPTYGDVRFRQAIAHAVDREAVIDVASPDGEPIEAIVAAGVPGQVPFPCDGSCDVSTDPDAARALLAEAFPDGAIPTVTLNGYEDPAQQALLDQVQADLEAVGIPVEQRVEAPDGYEAFVVSGEQGVFSLGTVGIAPMQDSYLGSTFLSTSWDNATGIRSDTLDEQIREARAEPDATQREATYLSVEQQVLAQYVQIPLYQARVRQIISDRVDGFETRLDGTIVLDGLSVAPG